jgi:hypothetical protein
LSRRCKLDQGAWIPFGHYLEFLFSSSGALALRNTDCFHSQPFSCPPDAQPCLTTGVVDKGKAHGVKVATLRSSAKKWWASNAYRYAEFSREPTGEELDEEDNEDQSIEDEEIVKGGSETADSNTAEPDDGERAPKRKCTHLGPRSSETEVSYESGVTDEGVPFNSSLPDLGRRESSTKTRAFHGAFSLSRWKSGGRDALKDAYFKLQRTDCVILHSCGCGQSERGGCVLGSHLRLGSQADNLLDASYHSVLRRSKLVESAAHPGAYLNMLPLLRESRGVNIF